MICVFLCRWSKAKLRSLLEGLVLTEEPKTFVDSVDKIEGEARVANRKGKLSFFYEWDIRLNWKGGEMIQLIILFFKFLKEYDHS